MTDYSDKCIVLKVSDYRDDDRLVKMLTAEHGMATALLRGVKKAKAKLKPFAQEFAVFDTRLVSGKGAFLTPVEPLLIQDGFSLCSDPKVFTAASLAAETTLIALGDEEQHTDVFVEFLRLLKAFISESDPYYQTTAYIVKLLGYTGFYKNFGSDEAPKTPVRLCGYAQEHGYGEWNDADLSRRALKYISSHFEHTFETGLKSAASIDIYA